MRYADGGLLNMSGFAVGKCFKAQTGRVVSACLVYADMAGLPVRVIGHAFSTSSFASRFQRDLAVTSGVFLGHVELRQ